MSPHAQLETRIARRIRELEAAGLRRSLRPPSGIDLSSNDYLGLSTHPLVKQRMAEAVMSEGCGSTASRLLRGDRELFRRVEKRFAEFKNTEAALYFNSGYTANLGVVTAVVDRHDLVFSDEYNHASLVDGIRLSRARRVKFPHCDVDRLARLLREAPPPAQKFLVTESLFSMDGDFAPLADYAELCSETGTALIVDEAHAVGVYGARGSGFIEQAGVSDHVLLSVNTAGKALGSAGAFVAGPAWVIDYLIQTARPFIFSTAAPPPIAAALEASLTVIETEPERRERVLKHSALLRSLLGEAGINTGGSRSQIIPVLLGDNTRACRAASELQAAGFDVRAIRPPAVPEGTARLRISVNAAVDEGALRAVAQLAARACR